MHATALNNARIFFETYSGYFSGKPAARVVEIGAQDVNGSLRDVCPEFFQYIGVDFQPGKGVDVVLDDPYVLPFSSESADVIVSSSCLEHSEMFWLVFLEMLRILKPDGVLYMNVPSAGGFHRYPVDCWRFYPDSAKALEKWARRNGVNAVLLESYTQRGGEWQDYVSIFIKDEFFVSNHPDRILARKKDFENGQIFPGGDFLNRSGASQNDRKLQSIVRIITE